MIPAVGLLILMFFFFKQKTAYEMRISDWSSDVCSSDLVAAGTSIMRAAMEIGTEIPKLCATDMLDAFGSCRICLVEIEGRAGTPASCTTPVAEEIGRASCRERVCKYV